MEGTRLEIKVDKWTFRVPLNRFYNENDCWAKIDGAVATVGVTDFLRSARARRRHIC